MKVLVKGKEVNLTSKEFKTQGGEGSIYVKSNVVYKIYSNQTRAIPENKFKELSCLRHADIIKPMDLVYNSNSNIVGYTMSYVSDAISLCQIFPKVFKDRNNISDDDIKGMVLKLRDLISSIHQDKCLVVDLNELNFLLDRSFNKIYAIDVDSYQTQSYPATAIMPSIKDWHTKKFDENSDWFSFGILAFQMFIGIHPYKGIHKSLKSLEDRMRNNISVFNKDVSLPKVCNNLSAIPKNWADWFTIIFDKGDRMAPPLNFDSITKVVAPVIQAIAQKLFEIKLLDTFQIEIEHAFNTNNEQGVIFKDKNLRIDMRTHSNVFTKTTKAISFLKTINEVCTIQKYGSTISVSSINSSLEIPCSVAVEGLLFSRNNLYIKSGENIYLLEYSKLTNSMNPVKVAGVMPNSTELFGGCLVQQMLGSKFLTYFNDKAMYNIELKITDKIINARMISSYLAIITINQAGEYNYQLFYADQTILTKIHEHPVSYNDINFTVIDSGTGFAILDDSIGVVFNKDKIKVIQSDEINMAQRLFSVGNSIRFFQGKEVYSLSLK